MTDCTRQVGTTSEQGMTFEIENFLLSYGLFQSTYIPVICEITDAKHESLPLPVNIVES